MKTVMVLIGIAWFASFPLMAQKNVEYPFRYQPDMGNKSKLIPLTQLNYASAKSIRVYFDASTRLGKSSYLQLEGNNGAKQVLDSTALVHWHHSSAYFNGHSVQISLFTAPGDQPNVAIKSIKVVEETYESKKTALKTLATQPSARQSATAGIIDDYPYAKAVGRFTNGNQANGTGWIAPNGAIVTSFQIYDQIITHGFDVIEFNVPLSTTTGQVNHPAPEDQYPLDLSSVSHYHEDIFVRKWYWSVWSPHTFEYHPGYAIIKVLPNGTGKTPGEREAQYFQILANPSSSVIEAQGSITTDVFHYSEQGVFAEYDKTLQRSPSLLYKASDFIKAGLGIPDVPHRDNFIIHDLLTGENGWSDLGAPITYEGTNVAIGIHAGNASHTPAIGHGFRDANLTNALTYFLSPKSVFVDANGFYESATGKVNKPYLTVQNAVTHAQNDAVLFIAKGTYNETLSINTPMTLRAPVGNVIIGAPEANARKSAGSSLPAGVLTEETYAIEKKVISESAEKKSFTSYPNPFQEHTVIQYQLAESGPAEMKVYDQNGIEAATLLRSHQEAGQHSLEWNGRRSDGSPLPTGIYIIHLTMGNQVKSIKVLKK